MNDTNLTNHLPLLFDELVKKTERERNKTEWKKNQKLN